MAAIKPSSTPSPRLREYIERQFPGSQLIATTPLASSSPTMTASHYRVVLVDARGERRELIWRVAAAGELGLDRRSDRAAGAIQAFEDFARTPLHVEALDVGVIGADGNLISLRDGGEPYLVTTCARGTLYVNDLRRIASTGIADELDVARCDALADYLAALHTPISDPARYRRAIRDLVGHGDGIFGVIDGYPDHVPGAPLAKLRAIETRCTDWRWRLRDRTTRLTRTHGDFHPFTIVWGDGTDLTLLDASRGACGDPADDLSAMAMNYLLFALDAPSAWHSGFGVLWHRFWKHYLNLRPDPDLLAVAPPFFMWRSLIACNPRVNPQLSRDARAELIGFATAALEAHALHPSWADELFR